MSLRPLTCHIPVIPGFVARRLLWCISYCSTSEMRGGLVPTSDRSPFSTLKNCGNSSMEKSLIYWPIPFFLVPSDRILLPMTLGSKSILNILESLMVFCAMSSFLRSSASMYMLRNLYILNILPFNPTLSCLKKIGPGDLMYMIGPMNMVRISVNTLPTRPPIISAVLLSNICFGVA